MITKFNPVLIDLGWCIGKLDKNALTIISPPDSNDVFFIPGANVCISGELALKRLRDTLLEVYPLENKGETP